MFTVNSASVMPANRISDITRRAWDGPPCSEKDFNIKFIASKVKSLIKEYEIKFDPETPVPSDDSLADDVYQAGLQLFLEAGVYCLTTGRRIIFTESEVREAMRDLPEAVTIGEGLDSRKMYRRSVEDRRPPVAHGGPTGTLCSPEFYQAVLLSYAQEPVIDSLGSGSIAVLEGQSITVDSPLNIRAAVWMAQVAREALRLAGRPGLHINDVALVDPLHKIACCNPNIGIRRSDGVIVAQMVELKVSFKHLSLVEYLLSYGCLIENLITPLLGGFAGGPEGTAVVTVAEHIAGLLCYHAHYHFLSLTHIRNINNTDRQSLWAVSVAGQALSRNTNIISVYDCYCASGPGTRMILEEAVSGGIMASASGLHVVGCGSLGGKYTDYATGLECRLLSEVSKRSAGMKREDANELVLNMLKHYEDKLGSTPVGKPFYELYDMKLVKPSREWIGLYSDVIGELRDFGLDVTTYSYASGGGLFGARHP